ncbi:MAG: TDP-N-acetylfucosamine:lipid II N-acetylfucosaminyltransferase [Phascolarctobacterium sp.]|nr:TDP-N-acetylfucosamine:lipid II N-acetylfucosaminyltransferase [Candidatus Phascolarctobacterium caballi]
MIVLHFICRDKFTSGYIDFMELAFPTYEHYFVTAKSDVPLECVDSAKVIYFNRSRKELYCGDLKKLLDLADKIIISGIWGMGRLFAFVSRNVKAKIYLHFWGGDFYCFRNKISIFDCRSYIDKYFQLKLIKECNSLIFLIVGEQKVFEDIVGIKKRSFIAPMMGNPFKQPKVFELANEAKDSKTFNILVGNSATETNHHIEIFQKLAQKNFSNVRIICPLSYGNDDNYRQKVLEYGYRVFGKSFQPILNFMKYDEYMKLLSTCDIGIFNCDRQQALGNIYSMLKMGKTIYLRQGTSMWNYFKQYGISVRDVDEIDNLSKNELVNGDIVCYKKNVESIKKLTSVEYGVQCWDKVFQS